ncbi:MAG: aminotransferase class V-fold PLP-dependent enzyme [Candidatus Pacearchaeota archaeon]
MFNSQELKKDFPIFENREGLVYLDNAATTQKPKQVIGSTSEYCKTKNANTHRGIYDLSEEATEEHENSRKKVADFINAHPEEVVFTRNATESLNLLSSTLKDLIPEDKDEVVLTEMEHHSNLIPWQQFAKANNFKLKFITVKEDFTLDYEKAEELINEKTAIVAFTHVSNVLGTINDAEKLVSLARSSGAFSIVDACQSAPHMKVDVKKLDCDFMAISGHKMLGPTGAGIVYGKYENLEKMNPFLYGGGMISSVSYENSEFTDPPHKFEAGTQNVAESVGLANAIDYLQYLGMNEIQNKDKELTKYAIEKLNEMEGIKIYNPGIENSSGIVSFNLEGVHGHDVAEILNEENVAIRAGHHCCMPLMKKFGVSGVCRASFYVYNTKEDVDKLLGALKKVKEVFGK